MSNVTARVEMAAQHALIHHFPHDDKRAIFDRGDVRIETYDGRLIAARPNARTAFTGISAICRNVHWDALDAAYFAGYAFWNYLSAPLLLTSDDIDVAETGVWEEATTRWHPPRGQIS